MVRHAAFSGRHARHSRTAESVEDHIPWLSVMEDVPHDGFMRDLGVVGVGVVDRVVLALAHIRSERLAAVWPVRVVGLAVMLDEVGNKRIRAGGVIWRIG